MYGALALSNKLMLSIHIVAIKYGILKADYSIVKSLYAPCEEDFSEIADSSTIQPDEYHNHLDLLNITRAVSTLLANPLPILAEVMFPRSFRQLT